MKRSLLAGVVLIAFMLAGPVAFAAAPKEMPVKKTGEKGVLVDPAVMERTAPAKK